MAVQIPAAEHRPALGGKNCCTDRRLHGHPARTGGTGGLSGHKRVLNGVICARWPEPLSRQPDSGRQGARIQPPAAFWPVRSHAGEHLPGAGADIHPPGGHSQGKSIIRRIPCAGCGHRKHRPASRKLGYPVATNKTTLDGDACAHLRPRLLARARVTRRNQGQMPSSAAFGEPGGRVFGKGNRSHLIGKRRTATASAHSNLRAGLRISIPG